MLLLFFAGCAYTVNTLAQVSPGGDGHEFYALVRTDYFGSPGHLRASEATLIRCVDKADPRATTCEPVLTSEQAFRVVDANKPITFGRREEAAPPDRTRPDEYWSAVALARSRLGAAASLIMTEGLNMEQAALVRAQARKEACALVATVTDLPCHEVLGFTAP